MLPTAHYFLLYLRLAPGGRLFALLAALAAQKEAEQAAEFHIRHLLEQASRRLCLACDVSKWTLGR